MKTENTLFKMIIFNHEASDYCLIYESINTLVYANDVSNYRDNSIGALFN